MKMLSLDEIASMVNLHFSIIKPLTWHYTGWALNNFVKETKKDPQSWDESLSRTEERRLGRALYRFQLHCNLFGVGYHVFDFEERLTFRNVDILRIFFCIYEPWEIEEIVCVYIFAKKTFDQVFDDVGPLDFDGGCEYCLPPLVSSSHDNASTALHLLCTTNNNLISSEQEFLSRGDNLPWPSAAASCPL